MSCIVENRKWVCTVIVAMFNFIDQLSCMIHYKALIMCGLGLHNIVTIIICNNINFSPLVCITSEIGGNMYDKQSWSIYKHQNYI